MKHRDVEFGIQRMAPAKFQWTVYPKEKGPRVVGKEFYETQEEAEAACRKEIDRALGGPPDTLTFMT